MIRRDKVIVVAGIIAMLLLAVLWWRQASSPSPNPGTASSVPVTQRETPSQTKEPATTAQLPTVTTNQRQVEGSRFGGLAALSGQPIEFYGKVIDQDNKPLPGVEVVGRTGSKTGFMQEEHRAYSTATGPSGLFSFDGFNGAGLVIDLKKPGYNFESSRRQFLYSLIDPDKKRFTPDRNNPVVFRMWKSTGAEPLVQYQQSLGRAPIDGTPVQIDLAKGKLVKENGDLLVSVSWGPRIGKSFYAFDWSVKLSVPGGGIMEGGDDTMFYAPADGYQESLDYRFSADERKSQLHKTFYVSSRNRQTYSRVELWVANQPGDSETDVTGRVWLNPKPGSRNLEPPVTAQALNP